jgi:co-chaperonin GroES (HSP10)
MKPVLHRLLVKKDPVEKKTQSGLILAINERSEAKAAVKGTVIKVGNTAFGSFGSDAYKEGVLPGVRIYFAKYAGAELGDESDLIWLNDEDVLGVIDNE